MSVQQLIKKYKNIKKFLFIFSIISFSIIIFSMDFCADEMDATEELLCGIGWIWLILWIILTITFFTYLYNLKVKIKLYYLERIKKWEKKGYNVNYLRKKLEELK